MRLSEILGVDRVHAPAAGDSLASVLTTVLAGHDVPGADPAAFAHAIAAGERGEVVRLGEGVVAVLDVAPAASACRGWLGVSAHPFSVGGPDGASGAEAPVRGVFVFLCPKGLASFRAQAMSALRRWLREDGHETALLGASSPAAVAALPGLFDVNLAERLKVEAAMEPVRFRLLPDAPLGEIVDLMVRRRLHALPVVGPDYEVLGMISAGDVLRSVVPARRGRDAGQPADELEGVTARDVMTRSVLCVSEDQTLLDAATMMINRDVEQLPVVREGALVGFVTRDAVLRALYGGAEGAPSR